MQTAMEENEAVHLVDESSVEEAKTGSSGQRMKWGAIALKFVYPGLIAVIFGLSLSSQLVDKYFVLKPSVITMELPNQSPRNFTVPEATITATEMITTDQRYKSIPYENNLAPLDDDDFFYFQEYFIGMRYTIIAWDTATILGYVVSVLTGLALLAQLVFRQQPSTHAFKPGSFIATSWKNALPIWLLFAAVGLCVIRLLLVTSFVQSLSTRWAINCIRSELSRDDWLVFLRTFYNANPRTYQLEVLQSLGFWFMKNGVTWQFSTISLLISMALIDTIFIAVFYLDMRVVRFKLKLDKYHQDILAIVREQIRFLPKQARILPLWFSGFLAVFSVLFTKVIGRFVRNWGKSINRLPWTVPSEEFVTTIDDLIISHTGNYWFNPHEVVDGTVLVWVPLVFVIALGSVDRISSLSKFLESLAYGYLLRCISIAVTIYPTSVAVMQSPHCYTMDQMSFWEGMMEVDFCNDMMYSGHASLVVTPAAILILMLIYGPYKTKALPIIAVIFTGLFSCSVVVTGRFHYTADVLVTCTVCSLITLVNAPAWKVLFSYGKYELKVGSTVSIHKVSALMEEIGVRVVSITKSRRIDMITTDWDHMNDKLGLLKDQIEKAHRLIKKA